MKQNLDTIEGTLYWDKSLKSVQSETYLIFSIGESFDVQEASQNYRKWGAIKPRRLQIERERENLVTGNIRGLIVYT